MEDLEFRLRSLGFVKRKTTLELLISSVNLCDLHPVALPASAFWRDCGKYVSICVLWSYSCFRGNRFAEIQEPISNIICQ